jgi:hypothetical protein
MAKTKVVAQTTEEKAKAKATLETEEKANTEHLRNNVHPALHKAHGIAPVEPETESEETNEGDEN